MTLQVKLAGSHGIVGWGGVHNFNLQQTTSVLIKNAACERNFYNMLCATEVPTAFSVCKGGSYKILYFCVKEVCACLCSVCALLHTYLSRSGRNLTLLAIISYK